MAPPSAAAQGPQATGTVDARALTQATDAQLFLKSWLALAVARLPGLTGALLLAESAEGAMVPAAIWPDSIADMAPFAQAAQACVDQRRDVVLPLAEDSPARVIASPMFSGDRLAAVAVLVLARPGEADVQRVLADVQWGAGWVDALSRERGREADRAAIARARAALDLVGLIAQYDQVDEASSAVAAELARADGAWRVAIGLVRRQRVRLAALSHAAWFEKRSQQAALLERAMAEAVEQRASLSAPPIGEDRLRVEQAQQDLLAALPGAGADTAGIVTVPIVAGSRAVGAVVWHLPAQRVTPEFMLAAQGKALVLAPLLARLQDESRWLSGAVPARLRRARAAVTDPRRPGFAVGALLLAAALAIVAFAPTGYRVPARASLEGQVQRVIAAPFEGYVVEAPARAGQRVARGDLLARLEDRDLALERARLASELGQTEKKHAEALAQRNRAEAAVLGAQMAETEARLQQIEQRLQRTRLEAPFDAIVVNGDWSQSIGSPVEQGKTLFTLAPLQGYRVALKVDERDVRAVQPGQRGELVLAGMADTRIPFTVRHVTAAAAEDGVNLFRVEADLERAPERLRPGMEGVGKIDAGERTLLWIWTHRAVDWLRMAWWRYLP